MNLKHILEKTYMSICTVLHSMLLAVFYIFFKISAVLDIVIYTSLNPFLFLVPENTALV